MKRIESLDSFRALAILAVIVIHTLPFGKADSPVGQSFDAATVANQLARFAVPFFFVIAGYFWGKKAVAREHVVPASMQMARRLISLLVFWSLIYVIPFNLDLLVQHGTAGIAKGVSANLSLLASEPGRLILEGSKGHLWFLPALLCCLVLSALLIVCDTATPLLLLAIVLYVLGLLGGAYVDTPLGIHMGFNTRNGPFFGLIFYVSGYRLSRQQTRATWFFNGLALLLGGYGLQFLELAFLQHQFASTLAQDYVAGTYFVGLGSAMMALSNHAFLRLPGLRAMGPLVLGIYAIHVAFIELLYPVRYFNASPLWDIGFVLLVFALSFLSASLLARTAFGRRMTA